VRENEISLQNWSVGIAHLRSCVPQREDWASPICHSRTLNSERNQSFTCVRTRHAQR